MMDKEKHSANAFYYSCWGANPVVAQPDDFGTDEYGFSYVGNDGEQHDFEVGYYATEVEIPKCVPDGYYVFGWAWYGGTSGTTSGNFQEEPKPYGNFGDYWSCSFVRILGGGPVESSCDPIFDNDMSTYSSIGCMASADRPGVCAVEPCYRAGKYRKPQHFKWGSPLPLTPENFEYSGPPPRSVSLNVCKCLAKSWSCTNDMSAKTLGYCKGYTGSYDQNILCKQTCCDLCEKEPWLTVCGKRSVRRLCRSITWMVLVLMSLCLAAPANSGTNVFQYLFPPFPKRMSYYW